MTALNQPHYYAQRAPEYEKIYQKPERQPDLAQLREHLQAILSSKKVLEIACGTGFWTQAISETAHSVLATDINEPMLDIARQKMYTRQNVAFEIGDMFDLRVQGSFDALFGGFIWSHIPLEKLGDWLDQLRPLLEPKSMAVFVDNRFVAGSSTPISGTDANGNTIQQRRLADGTEHLVLKNFPGQADFDRVLAGRATKIETRRLEYFWILKFEFA